ncbi:MAG: phosphomannomutase/phosphoglucomutase, partial [Deltaproteobacteria bacterium]|nr:phosphomannomutase/phosphoglucomutase [Deltaproteobacteria bacterium]
DFVEGDGSSEEVDVVKDYKERLTKDIVLKKPLRVGVDAGNGTAGVAAVPILRAIGCEVHELFTEPDGTFPNHEPDPTVADNMKHLVDLVRKHKLDVGIGFDGDGDRIGIIDENGHMIYGDQLLIIFARDILSRKPGAVFISEVKCSQTMYDDIEKHGGKAIMWKTGHSLIKGKMKEEKADLAGEMSGHMFFADRYYGFDDATYAACRLVEIMSNTGKTINQLLDGVPETFSTPEIRVDCPDDEKFDVVKKVTDYFKSHNYDVIDIDGARVKFEGGWGLVRASNTQPVLVLRFEALSSERLEEIKGHVERVVAEMRR